MATPETTVERRKKIGSGIEIINYIAVIGNSSVPDGLNSGNQMVLFCPPEATLLVQIPEGQDPRLPQTMFELEKESLEALGIKVNCSVGFTENVSDYIKKLTESGQDIRLVPSFLSTILLPDNKEAGVVNWFNNKKNLTTFMLLMNNINSSIQIPYTFTGLPSVEEIRKKCIEKGSNIIFFKQNISTGGHGIEKFDINDESFEKMYTKKLKNSSEELDFHIQIGVPNIKVKNGSPESPCITAVIGPNGETKILQVALQRLLNGTMHIGNVIDPNYETEFLDKYGEDIKFIVSEMAKAGLRGHLGLDVVVDENNKLHLIEVNPRLNSSSRCRILRDRLPKD